MAEIFLIIPLSRLYPMYSTVVNASLIYLLYQPALAAQFLLGFSTLLVYDCII